MTIELKQHLPDDALSLLKIAVRDFTALVATGKFSPYSMVYWRDYALDALDGSMCEGCMAGAVLHETLHEKHLAYISPESRFRIEYISCCALGETEVHKTFPSIKHPAGFVWPVAVGTRTEHMLPNVQNIIKALEAAGAK